MLEEIPYLINNCCFTQENNILEKFHISRDFFYHYYTTSLNHGAVYMVVAVYHIQQHA